MEHLTIEEMQETVKKRFPDAFCKKISENEFYAVYKTNDMWRERLSLSPFEGNNTATSENQAWKEAYAKVLRMNTQLEIF